MKLKMTSLVVIVVAAMSSAALAQNSVARFDEGYLDQHPAVARSLGQNPGLVDNPQFLATHPGLDSYLAAHPGVRTELQTHPERFMTDEWRHDVYGERRRQQGIKPGEVAAFDAGYLDKHPEVARALSQNPGLVDNPQFLATHPGLDSYLAAHPGVRTELQTHPERFMTDEWRHDVYGERRRQQGIKPGEVAAFDAGYLDKHPEVARALSQNPRLVDNPQFLATHPGLDSYLAAHPGVRNELQSHPHRFMTDESRREHRHKAGS